MVMMMTVISIEFGGSVDDDGEYEEDGDVDGGQVMNMMRMRIVV